MGNTIKFENFERVRNTIFSKDQKYKYIAQKIDANLLPRNWVCDRLINRLLPKEYVTPCGTE